MRVRALLFAVGGICSVGFVAAVLFPVFATSRGGSRRPCIGNIHSLSASMLMYDEREGALPGASHWMDDLAPFVRSESTFHCPSVVRENRFEYGYSTQTRLGGKQVRSLEHPDKEPLVFDSFPIGRNAHTDHPIIAGFSRHNGQNVGYADGHAKFLKSEPLPAAGG